jgi:hypothetical protein
MSHVLVLAVSADYRPASTLQILFLAKVINFSTDSMHESIAKEDIWGGLLANEDARETLIKLSS